jgi:hypothetical protein
MEDDNCIMNENEPPYSIIPITYSNLELLPIHFSYDPGSNFDWSKCQISEENNNIINNKQSNHQILIRKQSSSSSSNNNVNIKDMELTRDQKMHLLQSYLNLVKIQLINQNCVSLIDIHVEQKLNKNSASSLPSSTQNNNNTINGKKFSKSNSTLKKILNIFRRDSNNLMSNNNNNDDGNNKNVNLKHYHQDNYHFNSQINSSSNCNYKKYTFKSWNSFFDTLNSDNCIVGSRLSLEKPPKFDKIIENYIESARNKFDIIKREQKLFVQHQQQYQQQNLNNNNNNYVQQRCTNCRNLLNDNDLCKNCYQAEVITHH